MRSYIECDGGNMNFFDGYENKSEQQLNEELKSMVARMKAEGTFDAGALERAYEVAYPFLNEDQRRKMRSIIDMVNE